MLRPLGPEVSGKVFRFNPGNYYHCCICQGISCVIKNKRKTFEKVSNENNCLIIILRF